MADGYADAGATARDMWASWLHTERSPTFEALALHHDNADDLYSDLVERSRTDATAWFILQGKALDALNERPDDPYAGIEALLRPPGYIPPVLRAWIADYQKGNAPHPRYAKKPPPTDRDIVIAEIVYTVSEWFGLLPTRNAADKHTQSAADALIQAIGEVNPTMVKERRTTLSLQSIGRIWTARHPEVMERLGSKLPQEIFADYILHNWCRG